MPIGVTMSTQSTRIPKCRHHKASGQARVTINGKDHYLGAWGSPESKRRYRKVLAEHLGKQPRTIADELEDGGRDVHEVTIETVLAAYWQHASAVYVDRASGKPKPSCRTSSMPWPSCGGCSDREGRRRPTFWPASSAR